jgi:uncharacterized NAD(P)/FAD-binding protein YdhS
MRVAVIGGGPSGVSSVLALIREANNCVLFIDIFEQQALIKVE